MVAESGWSRPMVNANVGRLRRMFKWAASEQLVNESVWRQLSTVEGLRRGKSQARETKPIEPVADATVDATLPKLSPVVADMVRLQRLTGMRPGEVCLLRPDDLDRSADVWSYKPHRHKTEHHGRERIVFIGPKAQILLRPYLLRESRVNASAVSWRMSGASRLCHAAIVRERIASRSESARRSIATRLPVIGARLSTRAPRPTSTSGIRTN
jgi:integrase